jgi:hypothetical protein
MVSCVQTKSNNEVIKEKDSVSNHLAPYIPVSNYSVSGQLALCFFFIFFLASSDLQIIATK